jgi:hypothetical protein
MMTVLGVAREERQVLGGCDPGGAAGDREGHSQHRLAHQEQEACGRQAERVERVRLITDELLVRQLSNTTFKVFKRYSLI